MENPTEEDMNTWFMKLSYTDKLSLYEARESLGIYWEIEEQEKEK